jgi:hypothetical protein
MIDPPPAHREGPGHHIVGMRFHLGPLGLQVSICRSREWFDTTQEHAVTMTFVVKLCLKTSPLFTTTICTAQQDNHVFKETAQTISRLTAPATERRAQTNSGSVCTSYQHTASQQHTQELYLPKIYMPFLRVSFQTRTDEETLVRRELITQ